VTLDDSPMKGRLIFNVGSRRSGTFWLQRIVSSHPEVAAIPSETHLLSHGVAPLFDRFQHDDPASSVVAVTYMPRDALLDSTRDFLDAVFSQYIGGDVTRVAERSPWHGQHLPLIYELYPDARFVHIIRDGRDVVRSLIGQHWGPRTIGIAAEEWRFSVASARAAALSDAVYREVRYEELLEHPRPIIEGLFEWLGLQLDEPTIERAIATSRQKENVDKRSPEVGAEKWRSEFSREDLEQFNFVAGRLLRELGYEWAEPDELDRATTKGSDGQGVLGRLGRAR